MGDGLSNKLDYENIPYVRVQYYLTDTAQPIVGFQSYPARTVTNTDADVLLLKNDLYVSVALYSKCCMLLGTKVDRNMRMFTCLFACLHAYCRRFLCCCISAEVFLLVGIV